ncbi:MAG: TRAP transporter substrate-binding protein DctP [Rhodobiaceae bacterium]|nr:TRAP transporter substrate-binding protein DctP [Rhodobiaceae bacterium]MCC0056274.1 TRAP transporter substrate-binding protein DctP [Rhodobiaceae bacterium]
MKFLKKIALLAAVTLIATPAFAKVDGPNVNWRFATFGKPRAATTLLEEMKKYVEAETDGKFTITIGYGTFGEPKEFLDLLKIGSVQGALVSASYTPARLPLYTVLDLPFLPLGDINTQRMVHDKLHADPRIKAEFAAWNGVPFMSSLLPQYELVGKGDAPTNLDALKGKRVRALGGMGQALEKVGAVPTNIPAPEIYNAFDRGLLDVVALPFYAHDSFKTYEIGDWMTTNLGLGTIGYPLVLSISDYEALPAQYKELLNKAREVAYEAQMKAMTEGDQKALEKLGSTGKMKLVKLDEGQLDQFRQAAGRPVWDEWAAAREKDGVPGKDILQFLLDTAKEGSK